MPAEVGGCEPAQQQVLLPRLGAAPQRRGQQHEDIIEYDEQPRERRRGHGDEVVGRVAPPAALVDLEFTADVDHDEAQTDVQQRVGRGLERGVSRAEKPREQLGRDESQHQEKGNESTFRIGHAGCLLGAATGRGAKIRLLHKSRNGGRSRRCGTREKFNNKRTAIRDLFVTLRCKMGY